MTGTATDVGDLTAGRYNVAGQSSATHGYSSGGSSPTTSDVIDKFSFATDGDATDVGDLTVARYKSAGQSSTERDLVILLLVRAVLLLLTTSSISSLSRLTVMLQM